MGLTDIPHDWIAAAYKNKEKIKPPKCQMQMDLFHKWRHLLSQRVISQKDIDEYKKDVSEFMETIDGKKFYKQTNNE